jgi:ribonuclease R
LIGHYALASEHYTHFTSPIRRYPDLVVHRGLAAYLEARRHGPRAGGQTVQAGRAARASEVARRLRHDPRLPDEGALHELGRHCSGTERNAEAAERELRNYLVLALLAEHLGDDFDGTVTGVTGDGVYVQLDRYLVDGFIRVTDLEGPTAGRGERWVLDRQSGRLVAQRSGRSISIGRRFVVRIVRVNPARRHLELAIVADRDAAAKPAATHKKPAEKPHREQPAGAKQSHQQSMRIKQQRERDRKAQWRQGRRRR